MSGNDTATPRADANQSAREPAGFLGVSGLQTWLVGSLVFIAGLACFGAAPPLAAATPLNSSVLLLDRARLAESEAWVDQAARTGGGRLQVVVNLFARLDRDLRVIEYGLLNDRRRSWSTPDNFAPIGPGLRGELVASLTRAFERIDSLGLDAAILPHLDAAGAIQEWRNRFDFDPTEKINGYSYHSALIDPVAEAAAGALGEDRTVWFALGGEMGESLFRYPAGYEDVRSRLASAWSGPRLRIGISLNHTEPSGRFQPGGAKIASTQALLDRLDFVGFSCYRPFQVPPTPSTFHAACDAFRDELSRLGLEFPTNAALHLTEIGLGGGKPDRRPPSPAAAAAEPWEGVPRGQESPWQSTPAMKRLRREYYAALLAFLEESNRGGLNPQPEAAFLWSEGSWEPMGVDSPRYADEAILRAVRAHNRAIDGLEGPRGGR